MADTSVLNTADKAEVKKSAPSLSWVPGRKILVGGLAGIVTFGALTGLKAWAHIDVQAYLDLVAPPPGTYSAQAIITTAVTLGVSYVTPPTILDIIRHLNDRVVQIASKLPDVPVSPK